VALIGQITFGLLLDSLAPRNTPARTLYVNLHKSTGVVLGLLILARIGWRLWRRPPAWPSSMPKWQRSAARLGHGALYVCMVVMPLSGYVASNFSKYGVKFFGHALAPWGPEMPSVYSAFNVLHVVTAFVFCGLILGHVVVALKHAWVDHDGVFRRIWPWGGDARLAARRSFIFEEKSS
jgi:cytochrome b561